MGFEPPLDASVLYASWGRRFVAWSLDVIILYGPIYGAAAAIGIATGDAASGILALVLLGILSPLYYAFSHAGWRGQTLGKRALGISVRNVGTFDTIGLGRALTRAYVVAALWVFSGLTVPLVLDILWPLWDPRNQALHDKVAASVVVRV